MIEPDLGRLADSLPYQSNGIVRFALDQLDVPRQVKRVGMPGEMPSHLFDDRLRPPEILAIQRMYCSGQCMLQLGPSKIIA